MRLTKATTALICELEQIIGDECYNPNSLNGWTLEEGCSFRYPVSYVDKEGNQRKRRWTIDNIDKKDINTMHYKFGSNNLYIGSALVKLLNTLEDRYGIDFNELEKNR